MEDKLQAEIYKWFHNNYCLTFHEPRLVIYSVPNGGTRNKIEAMKLKATGLTAGVADLIVCLPFGRVLFVELKTEIGTQSEAQKTFESKITKLGHDYFLIRSLEEFKNLIHNYYDND